MALYATLPHFPPSSSVSWRHYVHEIFKTDIENEAASLLKTKGEKFEFSHGEAASLLIQ
jgi:hypothetical protein